MKTQPWIDNPFRLLSWRDMLAFSATAYFRAGATLTRLEEAALKASQINDPALMGEKGEHLVYFQNILDELLTQVRSIDLKISAALIARFKQDVFSATKTSDFLNWIHTVRQGLDVELGTQLFFWIPSQRAEWYSKSGKDILGEDCVLRFANSGLSLESERAAKCYALGQYTACAYHLMRITEAGVKALALASGYPWAANPNWGGFFKQYDAQLATKPSKHTPPWDTQAPFFEEAGGNLRAVKDAWRNDTMHLEKSYDEEEARHLLAVIPSFMRKIAAKIDETGNWV